jgi:vacuolar-type H+-ATPase subunit F/Vma7
VTEVTRMIAMGDRPLMEGFALLGFETWPNATTEELDQLLLELLQSGQKALLLLETYLSQSQTPLLAEVRTCGGKIIVTEVPSINACQNYHPFVEDLVVKVLGKHAL